MTGLEGMEPLIKEFADRGAKVRCLNSFPSLCHSY